MVLGSGSTCPHDLRFFAPDLASEGVGVEGCDVGGRGDVAKGRLRDMSSILTTVGCEAAAMSTTEGGGVRGA